jgi:hypothetical protein
MSAQVISLKASVPFDFVVAGQSLLAGAYDFGATTTNGLSFLRNTNTNNAPTVFLSSAGGRLGNRGEAFLVFHRYGNQYFLSRIWDGHRSSGREIPMSHAERELTKTASLGHPETLMVLASR